MMLICVNHRTLLRYSAEFSEKAEKNVIDSDSELEFLLMRLLVQALSLGSLLELSECPGLGGWGCFLKTGLHPVVC